MITDLLWKGTSFHDFVGHHSVPDKQLSADYFSNEVLFDAQCGKKSLMPYANIDSPDERVHPCSLI